MVRRTKIQHLRRPFSVHHTAELCRGCMPCPAPAPGKMAAPALKIFKTGCPAQPRHFFPLPRPAPTQEKAAPCIPGLGINTAGIVEDSTSALTSDHPGCTCHPQEEVDDRRCPICHSSLKKCSRNFQLYQMAIQ